MKYKCSNYIVARSQRYNERESGEGDAGTMGYELMGCYTRCTGYDEKCPSFYRSRLTREMEDNGLVRKLK